jgi:hypothetical protein
MPPQSHHDLVPVSSEELTTIPGFATTKRHQADFPRRSISPAELRARQKRFITSVAAPTVRQPRPKRIAAPRLTAAQLNKLRAVHQSEGATAEMVAQKLGPDELLGTFYSSLTALQYTKMQAERRKRLRGAKNRDAVEAQWAKVVEGAQQAFAAAGLKGVTEARLDRMAKELNKSRANFNAVVDIANSGADNVIASGGGSRLGFGNYVTIAETLAQFLDPVFTPVPPDLCERPVQGTYTKHISVSFSLSVRVTYWCPTWTNPFRTCTTTFTVAGVTFSAGLDIGYRITCCGAYAWGAAYAQACATIVGITVCASCSARVVGIAGVGRSGSGSSCSYGLAVTAELKCTVGGVTIFDAYVPYGWTVTGPCPPASLPC